MKILASLAAISLILCAPAVYAEADPATNTSSGWYVSSQSVKKHNFDVWQLNSGYSYSVAPNLQLYLSTSLYSGNETVEPTRGLTSGIKYGITPRVSIESAVTTSLSSTPEDIQNDEKVASPVSFEVSSRFHITENVNVHATYDYESVEQQYILGIGYRF
ncbi:hypothetical protein [Thaumasiovibrio subtropicus]|uniref:hypothetical protein n=1 Tax=Thaumasiovibrio subtropicus TaxID=1891207 RepID=UPI000B361E96|nr:hypothetical protein [Thaumasiovibrio subtropicus]